MKGIAASEIIVSMDSSVSAAADVVFVVMSGTRASGWPVAASHDVDGAKQVAAEYSNDINAALSRNGIARPWKAWVLAVPFKTSTPSDKSDAV